MNVALLFCLASSLNEDELNDLIFEFQDDMEFWSTIGIEPPPLPPGMGPGGEFGPEGPFPPGGEFGPEGPGPMPPVYMPPPESLESIRGGDKDSKKGAIFELAGQEGGIAGLASSLNEDELNDLIAEFQDDMEFWSTIGIEPPPLTASEDDLAETSLAGEGGGIDTPLTPEDEQISLIGVENGTIV